METRHFLVVFGCTGGFSDIGKFAIGELLARQDNEGEKCTFRAVCLSPHSEKMDHSNGLLPEEIGFLDKDSVAKLTGIIAEKKPEIDRIYVDDKAEDVERQMNEVMKGVDTVISAFGNRQIGFSRHNNLGSRYMLKAMERNGVSRIIQLSSIALNEDFIRPGFTTRFFAKSVMGFLFYTFARGSYKDLLAMEKNITKTKDLDYILVKAMGLTPDLKFVGRYDIFTKKIDPSVKLLLDIPKPDMARFFVDEALHPSLHRCSVTVGLKPQEL